MNYYSAAYPIRITKFTASPLYGKGTSLSKEPFTVALDLNEACSLYLGSKSLINIYGYHVGLTLYHKTPVLLVEQEAPIC